MAGIRDRDVLLDWTRLERRYQTDLALAPPPCSIIGAFLSKASRHRPCPVTLLYLSP